MEESREATTSTGYGKPPWSFKGRAVYQLHLVKSQVARPLIPKEFKLVEAFGYTLGGFFLAHYDDSPAGVFDELVVIPGIVWNPPTSCAWASKVLVNSNAACSHGRTDVGLPSNVARFTKKIAANGTQQQSRFSSVLKKMGFSSGKPSPKFDLETRITEINDPATVDDIFSINLLSSLPMQNSQGWLGPQIKMSLPSFSGRTNYNPSLLKYSCKMECRIRAVHPLQISRLCLQSEQKGAEEESPSCVDSTLRDSAEKSSSLSLSVMLSKPILALEFSCLSMSVEAPLTISD